MGDVGTQISAAKLVEAARTAAIKAYAPYSGFAVGCAIESVDGEVVVGANMENACYRLGVCAEISALTAAAQAFGLDRIARIAVTGGRVGPSRFLEGDTVVTCCGGCRQSIYEAAAVAKRDIPVIASSGDGAVITVTLISQLLPQGFGPEQLNS